MANGRAGVFLLLLGCAPSSPNPARHAPLCVPPDLFYSHVLERKRLNDPVWAQLLDHLRKKCEEHLTPGAPEHIDWAERRSPWWGNPAMEPRQLPRAIEHLAFGGVLLDKRYGDAARAVFEMKVKEWQARRSRALPPGEHANPWLNQVVNGVNLNCGTAILSLAIAFDLARHEMPPGAVSQLGEYLVTFVDYLVEHPVDVELQKPHWNIAAHGMAGLGLLSLSLRAAGVLDEARFARALAMAKARSRIAADGHFETDGAFPEGPGYGSSTFHSLAPLAWALARCGDRELLDHPVWPKVVDGLLYELIPGIRAFNPVGDAAGGLSRGIEECHVATVDWLPMVAALHRNRVAQWLWQEVNVRDGKVVPEMPSHARKCILTGYLLAYDPGVRPQSPADARLPVSKQFRKRDLVDLRTGWGGEDTLASFLCDPSPRGSHRQTDRNHFSYFALGEMFALDHGKSLPWGGLGESHNVPLVRGGSQRWVPAVRDGLKHVEFGEGVSLAEGEAGDGYADAERVTRRVALLSAEGGLPPSLIVADRIVPKDEGAAEYSWQLHTHPGNRIEIAGGAVTLVGGRKGHRCRVEIVTPREGLWQRDTYFDHPRLRYAWSGEAGVSLVVLAPYREGASAPSVRRHASVEGCALRLTRGGRVDTVLSAAPGSKVKYEGLETDAEFALVSLREGKPPLVRVLGGTYVTKDGRPLEVGGP